MYIYIYKHIYIYIYIYIKKIFTYIFISSRLQPTTTHYCFTVDAYYFTVLHFLDLYEQGESSKHRGATPRLCPEERVGRGGQQASRHWHTDTRRQQPAAYRVYWPKRRPRVRLGRHLAGAPTHVQQEGVELYDVL